MSSERDPDNVFSPDLYQSRFPDNATSLTDLPLDILVHIISYVSTRGDRAVWCTDSMNSSKTRPMYLTSREHADYSTIYPYHNFTPMFL